MKIHIASVHEGKKPFNCSICGARFAQKWRPENTCCNIRGISIQVLQLRCYFWTKLQLLWDKFGKKEMNHIHASIMTKDLLY